MLSAIPSSLIFGNVATASSGRQSVALTNSGDTTVTIGQVIVSGAGFSVGGLTPNGTLTPGQSASLVVSFVPTATRNESGSVTVDTTP